MEIAIEVLAIVIPILFAIVLIVFLTIIKYFRLWRYKKENDKGRTGEEFRRSRLGNVATSSSFKRQSVFSLPTVTTDSGDKSSIRSSRNPFKRR